MDGGLTRIYNSGTSDNPSFNVPAGIMTVGNSYYLRAEARDINTTDGDGVDDVENRCISATYCYRESIKWLS